MMSTTGNDMSSCSPLALLRVSFLNYLAIAFEPTDMDRFQLPVPLNDMPAVEVRDETISCGPSYLGAVFGSPVGVRFHRTLSPT